MGQKIRAARRMRGLTQTELAAGFVTPSMISQVEADRAHPSDALLNYIADRLGVPIEYFTGTPQRHISVSPQLLLAEYWLMSGRPAEADAILGQFTEPPTETERRQYDLLRARAHRMQKRAWEAQALIAKLLEEALRRQDKMLLFEAYRESGYVEYAMNRPDAARHEWNKALAIGESIAYLPGYASVPFHAKIADLYLLLHETQLAMEDEQAAAAALHSALNWTRELGTFQRMTVAEVGYVKQAMEAGETAVAESAMRHLVAALEWAQITASRLRIEVIAARRPDTDVDTWENAAASVTSANPADFLAAEMTRIRRALDAHQLSLATRRLERAKAIAADYCAESPEFADALLIERLRLRRLEAHCLWLSGEQSQAVSALRETVESARSAGATAEYIETLAELLQRYADLGDVEHALACSRTIEQVLKDPRFQW